MKPAKFDYLRAASLAEAHETLAVEGGDASIIAGGQTLVPLLSMRMARPKVLVDIMHVAELGGIAVKDNTIRVAATERQASLLAWPELTKRQPLLSLAMPWVGHAQTRTRGTVCGSVALADPSAEIPLALIALDGEIELSSAKSKAPRRGRRFLHRSDVHGTRGRRADRSGALPLRQAGRRPRLPRIRAPPRRFRHRRMRRGRRPRKARGSRSAVLPTGPPRRTSARSTAPRSTTRCRTSP